MLEAGCTIDTCNVYTTGIFALWWSKESDYYADAIETGKLFNEIREDLINYGLTVRFLNNANQVYMREYHF